MSRRSLLLGLALLSASALPAFGDDDDDDDDDNHNRASRAVAEGHALPLTEILKKVHARFGGEVIGIEFKSKNSRPIYKLKVVTPAGRLSELSVDATTGDILQSGGDD